MPITLITVDNVQRISFVGLNDRISSSRALVIVTGVALCSFKGAGSEFSRDILTIPTNISVIDDNRFVTAVASAWPASIANDGLSNNAGWAVDRVDVAN